MTAAHGDKRTVGRPRGEPTAVLTARVPLTLKEWVDGHSAARGITRSELVETALRELRERGDKET